MERDISIQLRWNKGQSLYNHLQRHGSNGSMENVLGQERGTISKTNFIIAVKKEFGIKDSITERRLGSFYDVFNNERIRCCEMLCTYLSISYQKIIMSKPKKIILHLCDCCSQDKVHIDTFHCVVNVGCDIEIADLTRWIDITCTGKAENLSFLDKSVIEEILNLAPSVALEFRENVRNRLSSINRLKLVAIEENQVIARVRSCSQQIIFRRTIRLWRHLLHLCFSSWALYSKEIFHKRVLESRMRHWKAKKIIHNWQKKTARIMLEHGVSSTSVRHKKQKVFRLWRTCVKFHMSYTLKPRQSKDIALAISITNAIRRRLIAKRMLILWYQEIITYRHMNEAKKWYQNYSIRSHLQIWQKYVNRERLEDQRDHRNAVLEIVRQMKYDQNVGSNDVMDIEPPFEQLPKEEEKEGIDLRTAYSRSTDNIILALQKKDRRKRYEKEKRDFFRAIDIKWDQHEKQRINEISTMANVFLRSGEGRDRIIKCISNMKRELKFPDITFSSPSSIALSLLDSKLGYQGLLSEVFLGDLERRSKNGGIVGKTEFQNSLRKYDLIPFEDAWLRDIFDGIGNDGGKFLKVKILKESMGRSRDFGGIEGCQWKKYVDPVNQMVVFHNVMQRKRVMEYQLTRKKMRNIASDHILYSFITKERKAIYEERQRDIERSLQNRGASAIQRLWIAKTRRIIRMKSN